MRGLTPLRGTWIAIAIMSPVLIAQIALAVPDFFAEDAPGEVSILTNQAATGASASIPMTTDRTDATPDAPESPTSQVVGELDTLQLPVLTDAPDVECLTTTITPSEPGTGKPQEQTDEPECTELQVSDEDHSSETPETSVAKRSEGQDKVDKDHDGSDHSEKNRSEKSDEEESERSAEESDESEREQSESDD